MVAKVNFSLVQGDTFSKNSIFRVKGTVTPVDLTGCVISGRVKSGNTYTDLTCTITNAATGAFKFGLSSAQTALLTPGVSTIEVQITFSDSTVSTLFTGNLVITKQVA